METPLSLKTLALREILKHWSRIDHPFIERVVMIYSHIEGNVSLEDTNNLTQIQDIWFQINQILSTNEYVKSNMKFDFHTETSTTRELVKEAEQFLDMARLLASEAHLAFRAFGNISLYPTPHVIWGKHIAYGVIRFSSPQLLDFHMTITADGERIGHVDVQWSTDAFRENCKMGTPLRTLHETFLPRQPRISVEDINDPLIRIYDEVNTLLFVDMRRSDLASKITDNDLMEYEDDHGDIVVDGVEEKKDEREMLVELARPDLSG
jgi:hypothetical protein